MAVPDQSAEGAFAAELNAWRSIQAGLAAIALVGVTLATAGPSFYLPVAFTLLTAAGVAAVLGLASADRVRHVEPEVRATRRDASSGQILSLVALLFILYLTGVWVLFLFLWPIVAFAGLMAWAMHRDRVSRGIPGREVRI